MTFMVRKRLLSLIYFQFRCPPKVHFHTSVAIQSLQHQTQTPPGGLTDAEHSRKNYKSHFVELDLEGQKVKAHETWLRHHCKCVDCFAWETNERKASPMSAWLSSKITTISQDEKELRLGWTDGHVSKFNLHLLIASIPRDEDSGNLSEITSSPVSRYFTSDKDPLHGHVIPYQHFMENDTAVSHMLSSVLTTGFGLVNNVRGLEETKLAHARISQPIRTMYGDGVTVLEPEQEHNDAAYSSVPLPLHTDTSYFTEPMGLQSFHVISRSQTGGLNCFSDGFLASKLLFDENEEFYKVLTETQLEFQYLEEGHRDLRSIGPTLLRHPVTGQLEQVRYNPRHITTVSHLSTSRIPTFYKALIRFTEILNENKIWIQLEPGTILWIDNWRILHGRSGFSGGRRAVASAYFPRSDWLSRARVLGINC